MVKAKRAWINKNECGGFWLCAGEAPNLFKVYEYDPTEILIATDTLYTHEETKLLITGAFACPLRAIYIEFENGELLNEISTEQFEQFMKTN
jgi:ferredoxin